MYIYVFLEYGRKTQNFKVFCFSRKFSLMTGYIFTVTKKLELILNEPKIFFCVIYAPTFLILIVQVICLPYFCMVIFFYCFIPLEPAPGIMIFISACSLKDGCYHLYFFSLRIVSYSFFFVGLYLFLIKSLTVINILFERL